MPAGLNPFAGRGNCVRWYVPLTIDLAQTMNSYHFPLSDAQSLSPLPDEISASVFSRGTMTLRHYKPQTIDKQKPHDRDEIYIVISGQGHFEQQGQRHQFQPNDVIFVPAGVEHRFFDFTDDFETWVVFYGPTGGENI